MNNLDAEIAEHPQRRRRIFGLGRGRRAGFGLALNGLVRQGVGGASIVIGRDHLDTGSAASPADGTLERVLTGDPGIGVVGHADAGRPEAIAAAARAHIDMPMGTPGGFVR